MGRHFLCLGVGFGELRAKYFRNCVRVRFAQHRVMVAWYLVYRHAGAEAFRSMFLECFSVELIRWCAQLLHAPAKPLGGLLRVNTRTLEPSDSARNKDELHLARSERKVHARVGRKVSARS